MGDLTKDFSVYEFKCPCCGESRMDLDTVKRLQTLRDLYGKRIDIVEGGGYRCAKYDENLGAHYSGRAVDPGVPREDLYAVMKLAFEVGFTGIGVKQKKGRWQLHLDDAPATAARPRPWIWTY